MFRCYSVKIFATIALILWIVFTLLVGWKVSVYKSIGLTENNGPSKLQDVKFTDQAAGHEFAGQENRKLSLSPQRHAVFKSFSKVTDFVLS